MPHCSDRISAYVSDSDNDKERRGPASSVVVPQKFKNEPGYPIIQSVKQTRK